MHPDAIIAALKVELADARDADHKKAIEAEIKRVDALERPKATAEEPETVLDRTRIYLDALKDELAESPESRHAEIKAEIKRVEGQITRRGDKPDAEKPSTATTKEASSADDDG